MRSFKRVLGMVFAIAMMVTCISFAVSADAVVKESGSVDGEYSYSLYSDGLLKVVMSDTDTADLGKISKTCLEKAISLSVDITGTEEENLYVRCDKSYCNIDEFEFICSDKRTVTSITLDGFPKFTGAAGSIVLPGNCEVWALELLNSNVTSVDFLKGLDIDSFAFDTCNLLESVTVSGDYDYCSVYHCDKVSKVDLRGCPKMTDCMIIGNNELKELYFPDALKQIRMGSCALNPKLTEVKIPDSVLLISDYAFQKSGLKSVQIPEGVMRIGMDAFGGCTSLETVYIPATANRIDAKAFIGCSSLKTVYFGGAKAQFEKIWVSNGSSSTVPIYDIFGDAEIKFDETKKSVWVCGGYYGGDLWFYFDDKGIMATGWKSVSGTWYLFDENSGVMLQNWQKSGNAWYYLGKDGAMRKGWQYIDSEWHYFGTDGAMRLGWQSIGGKWYYFDDHGDMITGWQSVGGTWYYFESSGAMATGWRQIGGYWYFFKSSGAMAAGEYCNGYWINSNGTWTYQHIAKWTKDNNGWWYGDSTGWYARNESVKIDGKVYNFDANGYCTNP